MTEIPKNFDEYPKEHTFEASSHDVAIYGSPIKYTIHMYTSFSEAFYEFNKDDMQRFNELMQLPAQQNFIESVKQLVDEGRAVEVRDAIRDNFKTTFTWISDW